jgi:hypothetical protein
MRPALKPYFTAKNIIQINEKVQSIDSKTSRLLLRYAGHSFSDMNAKEYAHHGFARRIQTLDRCIESVFNMIPPDAREIPSKAMLYDAQINIQSAIGNTYGCVDNLVWFGCMSVGLQSSAISGVSLILGVSRQMVRLSS